MKIVRCAAAAGSIRREWCSTGKRSGLLGLGNIGRRMAEYGKAFGMEIIAWSQNLTAEAAASVGVTTRREK